MMTESGVAGANTEDAAKSMRIGMPPAGCSRSESRDEGTEIVVVTGADNTVIWVMVEGGVRVR